MTTIDTSLLVAGLLFPTLSLLTSIASLLTRWKHGRYASPLLIPIVGPMLLTCWILMTGHNRWLIPLVWLLDIGTTAFFAVFPRLLAEWWQLSVFTRMKTLRGSYGIETAVLTFHQGGRYFLKKSWNRSSGSSGIVGLGEAGMFVDAGDIIDLKSRDGLTRRLRRRDCNTYDVEETSDNQPQLKDHSLHGWRFYG